MGGSDMLAPDGLLEKRLADVRAVIDNMSCGLFARDSGGRIVFVNETLLRWTGFTREELNGEPAECLAPPELRELIREERKNVDQGDRRARLCALRRCDGTTVPAVFLPNLLLDDSGAIVGGYSMVIELGAVETAKPVGSSGDDLRSSLHRIGSELQRLSLAVDLGTPTVMADHPDLADLTDRELEVLSRLLSGARVPAIASELGISPHTVRNHLKSMYRKVGAKDQSDLIEKVRSLQSTGTPTPPAD